MNANPAFSLDDANAAQVGDICRGLDGLPLGIELAAVRLRSLELSDLADRLDEHLRFENRDARVTSSRHASVAAALDLTHGLLAEGERRLWRRLAVFAGSFSLGAVLDVCSDAELPREAIVDTFVDLVEKSCVVKLGGGRYRLLEPIRQYCWQRLEEAGETARFRRSHFEWCQRLAESGGPWWLGLNQLSWLEAVAAEERNIQAALQASLEGVVPAEQGLNLLYTSWLAWVIRLSYGWTRHSATRLLDGTSLSREATVRGLLMAGVSAWGLGDWASATNDLLECCRQASSSDDLGLEYGYASASLSVITLMTGGDTAEGVARLQQAIALLEAREANALTPMFAAHLIRFQRFRSSITDVGFVKEQAEFATRVLAGSHDLWSRSNLQSELGRLTCILGEPLLGEQQVIKAVEMQLAIGNKMGLARSLETLAFIAIQRKRPERACALLAREDQIWDEIHAAAQLRETPDRALCDAAIRHEVSSAKRAEITREIHDWSVDLLVREFEAAPSAEGEDEKPPADVTMREFAVAQLIAAGASNKQIAMRLGITPNTAKTHIAHIMRKLALQSRAEVAAWYAEQRRVSGGLEH